MVRRPIDPRLGPGSLDRREALRWATASLGLPLLAPLLRFAPTPRVTPKADALIHVFLGGGLSHVDSFDPKPNAPIEVRGEFSVVKSKLDGEPLSQVLSRTAAVADRLAIVRSMTHTEAAHERGTHNLLTGYQPSPALHYPSMGAVTAHELGGRNDLPPYVVIPNVQGLPGPYLGSGYLSSAYGPFAVRGDPQDRGFAVKDLDPTRGVDEERLARRRRLLGVLESSSDTSADAVESTEAFYEQAWRLIGSPTARQAFRVDQEPAKTRDRYGRTRIGQRLLLARRLVASGVRYVTVLDDGYDQHDGIFAALRGRLGAFDQGFAALIAEMDEIGLLERTLVLVTTEFGRTPRVNATAGRDHWPRVFSVVLAGGGIRRGVVHGASDAEAREPASDPVGPADLAATAFTLLGIDPSRRLMSPGDRPIDIVRDGKVISGILA